MARKKSSKKKAVVEEPPPVAADEDTEDESIHDDNVGDVQMGSEDDIPDIVENDDVEEEDGSKGKKTDTKQTKKKDKKTKKDKTAATSTNSKMIPFMDTFYQLSSEDSPTDRAIAARDLIHHCFPPSSSEDDSSGSSNTNYKDAAYALTRLMNGLCTGRAASRQGFASCLSSFIKMAYPSMGDIIKEDDVKKSNDTEGNNDNEDHPAMIVREKLLTTTDFLTPATQSDGGGGGGKSKSKNKKNRFGGGGAMKGIEARDHAFGRLFGILAIVRSGTLSKSDMPSEVSL